MIQGSGQDHKAFANTSGDFKRFSFSKQEMKRRRKELKIPKFCLCSSNPVVFASVLANAVYSRFMKGVV